jgi:hypothetical protein
LITIFCNRGSVAYVFNEKGMLEVDLQKASHLWELKTNSHCCALVNLSDRMDKAPEVFYLNDCCGRVIIATSPNADHLSNFSKEHMANTYCMPTWSWCDIFYAR